MKKSKISGITSPGDATVSVNGAGGGAKRARWTLEDVSRSLRNLKNKEDYISIPIAVEENHDFTWVEEQHANAHCGSESSPARKKVNHRTERGFDCLTASFGAIAESVKLA